jgi:hypothetical protein
MDGKDCQFSAEPIISHIGENQFSIRHLLKFSNGPDWSYPLFVECEYCHKEIKVILHAPNNAPNFVKDEARRLAIIQHLRTEHTKQNKNSN